MEIHDTFISDLRILKPSIFQDNRGKFIKTFNSTFFNQNNLNIDIKETYYSISNKNIIRGMHFQLPPYDHIKIVYVPYGKILDVVLDIREGSPTYGQYYSTILSSENAKILIIPKGLAHGFKSLKNDTNVTYMQTSCYNQEHDYGIRYDSFEFDWECQNPTLSERDLIFKDFKNLDSLFTYENNL